MASAFVSREFGLGYRVPTDIINKINKKRSCQNYVSTDSAMEVLKQKEKKLLHNNCGLWCPVKKIIKT